MCLLLASASVRAQATAPQIPQPTGEAVNDFAEVIDPQTQQRLETILTNLKKQQNIEFGVVTVRTTGGMEIFDYAVAVGRGWGIGPQEGEQQGLLLIAAIDDRKYYTLVSRHLQGELTDGLVGSIQRQYLVPAFRAGNYGEGLMQTARAYIDTLAQKRGFSTAEIYQEPISTPPTNTRYRPTGTRNSLSGGCTCLIIIIILILLLSSRGRGGGGSGCLNLFLLNSLLNAGSRGGWSSSGWGSGGGFGGGSGGGGGGFGGFGGGGDFDGGGAGGSW